MIVIREFVTLPQKGFKFQYFAFVLASAHVLLLAFKILHYYITTTTTAGRSGLVVTRLPAARKDPGSRRAAGKSLCFHENHCDMQLWARAAH